MRNVYTCILVGCLLTGCSATQTDQLLDTILEALEEETQPVVVPTPSAPQPQPLPTPEPPILQPEPVIPQEPEDEKKPVGVDGRDCRGEPYNCCFTRNPDRARRLKWDGVGGQFLWKPGSDHHAGGVFLTPGWYGRGGRVDMCCSKKCEPMKDGDGGNKDPEGCRHHWRIAKSAKQIKRELGDSCYFVVDGRNEDLKLKDVSQRKE